MCRHGSLVWSWVCVLVLFAARASAQEEPAAESGDAGVAEAVSAAPVQPSAAADDADAGTPPPEAPASDEAEPVDAPPQFGPCGGAPCTDLPSAATKEAPPLFIWATSDLADSLGRGRCNAGRLQGAELALAIASTLKASVAAKGIGIATAGALGDHPLLSHAARHHPQQLAGLLAAMGHAALGVGVEDLSGPLITQPPLAQALKERNIPIVASNLECNHQTWCEGWSTAEDDLVILERDGRRVAFISILPDDTLTRVEPAGSITLRPAAETLAARTQKAREAGVELVVVSIDHGPDASAATSLAGFVASLPDEGRPDLVLSPSSGENLLFLRPPPVRPAVVGTRAGALTSLRVTKLPDSDADVLARLARLQDPDPELSAALGELGVSYCRDAGVALPGGRLDAPMTGQELVDLAGGALREYAGADLALLDPLVFDRSFDAQRRARLQRGQAERAVVLDSPLVWADVPLDWLGNLNKMLDGARPLVLYGTGIDRGDPTISGRITVVGATYRVVTSAVLARSGRLPDGPAWSPIAERGATLRGALLRHLSVRDGVDPRSRLLDPMQSTQWILRVDAQLQGSLTQTRSPETTLPGQTTATAIYTDEPAITASQSRQFGARLVMNLDADAPRFLFENALQVAFDKNFTTQTLAQNLAFLQDTYTYRGLWPGPYFYPHPFVESYVETELDKAETARYRHLMIRPQAGLRSMFSRVFSLKVSGGFQYEVLDPNGQVLPGFGAELVLRPTTVVVEGGTLQMEGNIRYFWGSPGDEDKHTLRGQVIAGLKVWGPLQVTLSALGVMRKNRDEPIGRGLSLQAGVRLQFVDRSMVE